MLVAALVGARTASMGSASGGGRAELMARTIGRATVLTDGRGFTLYWFALDTPRTSRCEGSCAGLWPPLTGRPVAGAGVTGTLGTIVRPGGSLQVTYDGHPLYTYAGDSSPGQTNGNGLDVKGGYWDVDGVVRADDGVPVRDEHGVHLADAVERPAAVPDDVLVTEVLVCGEVGGHGSVVVVGESRLE